VQAHRQVGSTFKPFVYTAAIDRGYTPATVLHDAPVTFPGGPGQPPYSPQNYDRTFEGPITLRRALEQSRNVPAVRLMDQLGPRRSRVRAALGFRDALPPYLSIALGAAEATLLEMTSAYSVFPNQGVRMRPYSILKVTDREGNVLEENRPEPRDAIRADTAFVMTNLLRGVVQRGTAARANALNWPLGGKTGTTDDYTDAWFIGFDPTSRSASGSGSTRRSRSAGETGASAALPIWIDIMKAWIGDRTPPRPARQHRAARQHRVRDGGVAAGRQRERSSPARSPGRGQVHAVGADQRPSGRARPRHPDPTPGAQDSNRRRRRLPERAGRASSSGRP
jgi:penicillin-binding protein 1A